MRRRIILISAILIGTAALLTLRGLVFRAEYSAPLTRGYYIFKTSRTHGICEPRGRVVAFGLLEAVTVRGPFIIGRMSMSADSSTLEPGHNTGYFVIDTRFNEAHEGLTLEEARSILKSSELPPMHHPDVWRGLFMHWWL